MEWKTLNNRSDPAIREVRHIAAFSCAAVAQTRQWKFHEAAQTDFRAQPGIVGPPVFIWLQPHAPEG